MMKYIKKGKEPASLAKFRNALTKEDYDRKSIFDEYKDKEDLKKSLLEEQGYICCYCMQRISEENMKIEHWKSQKEYPTLKFDYKNLLAACQGNEGEPPKNQHCDTKKSSTGITINPTHENCEQYFKYRLSGEIDFDNLERLIRDDLKQSLNLNHEILVRNRKRTLEAVIDEMNRLKGKTAAWSASDAKKKIQQYESKMKDGKYREYCQVVIYFLKKRFAKELGCS